MRQLIFTDISQDFYGKLLLQARAAGMQFAGNTASISGCTFYWSYDEASQTLTIQCVDRPWYKPCTFIAAKLQDLLKQARDAE